MILPHGPGRLQLGRAAEFLGKRAILPAPGHQPEIAVSSVDTVRGGEKTCCHGLDLDKLFEEAQSKDFKPVELPMRLQARVAS
jgi:hypothetical protein